MNNTTWLVTPPVEHITYIENLTVHCDYLFCTYIERFDNMEDAIVAMEIHEGQEQ
jgi:hypothetical protein